MTFTRDDYELAALAAGAAVEFVELSDGSFLCFKAGGSPCVDEWNPPESKADAFDLMVKLGLMVYVMREAGFTGIRFPGQYIGGKYDVVEVFGARGDADVATRHAIFRAAIEIGRDMKAKEGVKR